MTWYWLILELTLLLQQRQLIGMLITWSTIVRSDIVYRYGYCLSTDDICQQLCHKMCLWYRLKIMSNDVIEGMCCRGSW